MKAQDRARTSSADAIRLSSKTENFTVLDVSYLIHVFFCKISSISIHLFRSFTNITRGTVIMKQEVGHTLDFVLCICSCTLFVIVFFALFRIFHVHYIVITMGG